MNNNNSWKDIEVEVSVEAKAGYSYVANIINVEDTEKQGEPAYRLTYAVSNMNGDKMTVAKTVQKKFFKNWLSFHNGYDAKDKRTLSKIAELPQLILTDEYLSHVYVSKVVPLDNLEVAP